MNVAQRFHHFHYGNGRSASARRLETIVNHADSREGAHTIVHANDAFSVVGNELKAVFNGVEARLSAVRNLVFRVKSIILAELTPIVLLRFGQYQDDV